jgi:predicted Zn-dependent peptidase
MHEDDPGDLVHDTFTEAIFGDTPLGRPVLGTVESISSLSRASVAGYYRRRYVAPNIVVAVAGNIEHTAVVRQVRTAFRSAGMLEGDAWPSPARIGETRRPTRGAGAVALLSRPTEQANVMLGVPGVARTDERRFAVGVLNAALGGGMSSRLFQEVREKRGLAYSVYSYAAHYAGAGVFGVYAGCLPGKVEQVLDICRDELAKVAADGVTDEELARGQGQLRGSLVLGLEDSGSRMTRIGKNELVYGELLGVDELIDRISGVTVDDVRSVASWLLSSDPALAVIGPFAADRDFSAYVRPVA